MAPHNQFQILLLFLSILPVSASLSPPNAIAADPGPIGQNHSSADENSTNPSKITQNPVVTDQQSQEKSTKEPEEDDQNVADQQKGTTHIANDNTDKDGGGGAKENADNTRHVPVRIPLNGSELLLNGTDELTGSDGTRIVPMIDSGEHSNGKLKNCTKLGRMEDQGWDEEVANLLNGPTKLAILETIRNGALSKEQAEARVRELVANQSERALSAFDTWLIRVRALKEQRLHQILANLSSSPGAQQIIWHLWETQRDRNLTLAESCGRMAAELARNNAKSETEAKGAKGHLGRICADIKNHQKKGEEEQESGEDEEEKEGGGEPGEAGEEHASAGDH